ncbi:MarR family winged helix-turn-helix transcriptional regulator [Streptomyces sp. NPDC057002]|uniref:MarR family winged helix-turn-helix transcriptional regulator n=1 Tax=Streptomyces sp. NPDC057002 TaxID=3345992 RepID=UPI00363098E8
MSQRKSEQLPVDLVRLVWTLHRVLRRRQAPPPGESARPLAQVEVLRLVDSQPGITVREVAAALGMQPNNVSTLVTRLTRDVFIDRRHGTHDRRFVELHPTGKMLIAGGEVNESLDKAISGALRQLPPEAEQRISAALPELWELARALARTS